MTRAAAQAVFSIGETVRGLLAATPEAPHGDADPADVIHTAETMMSARAPYLDQLHAFLASDQPIADDVEPLLADLLERDQRWQAALVRARHLIAERLVAARRYR